MSHTTRRRHRATARQYRRRRIVAALVALIVLALLVAGAVALFAPRGETAPSDGATPAPSASEPAAEPQDDADRLLAASDDPAACVVVFSGDAIADAPLLQRRDELFSALPIPARDGLAFGGWYRSAEAAAARDTAQRVNGSRTVECGDDRRIALHAAWVPAEEAATAGTRIPILMYHQFTTRPEGEDGWLRGNYAYIGDFTDHIRYIAESGFYLPTWDELSAFIDGRLTLPDRSVIVTDDDADQSWFDLAVPVVDEYGVLATSFMVTIDRQDPAPSRYVLRRSHTHDMHRAGDDGNGRIVNLSPEEIAADLEASAEVLGAKEVLAYPFGHYDDTAKEGLRLAGFDLARTTEPGYVEVGTDKLALPTIRIDYGMGLDALVAEIG